MAYGIAIGVTLLGDAETFLKAGQPLALITAPTRELALQVQRELGCLLQARQCPRDLLRRRHGPAP